MAELSTKQFYEDLAHYRRDNILKMLKAGVLKEIDEADKTKAYQLLIQQKDTRIIDALAKEITVFPMEVFEMDLKNLGNREIINYIFNKYSSKLDKQGKENSNKLFEIAVATENKKLLGSFIKENVATESYGLLASCSDEGFRLVSKIKKETLTDDLVVDLFVNATAADNPSKRIQSIIAMGLDLGTKNSDGKTAYQVFADTIQENKYTKNKNGALKKANDQSALNLLNKKELTEEKKESDLSPKTKKVMIILIAIIVILLFAIGFILGKKNSSSSDSESVTSTEAAYDVDSTETSGQVVEDGDTVNIDYTGYIDGVAFDGGSTNGAGTDLTIGSGTYIDDFEEQLIGHSVGEEVEVNVTFPDDYGVDELNGQDATFEVTINAIE